MNPAVLKYGFILLFIVIIAAGSAHSGIVIGLESDTEKELDREISNVSESYDKSVEEIGNESNTEPEYDDPVAEWIEDNSPNVPERDGDTFVDRFGERVADYQLNTAKRLAEITFDFSLRIVETTARVTYRLTS